MLKCHLYLLFWTELALAIIISHAPVNAQVTPDNSLGTQSSIVNPNVTVKDAVAELISGGAVRGNNLFHSFGEFNVGDGARVYFANPDGVANILTRVTGSNLSQINGTLGVEGGANLFILNPNGIVFGENAALDINGSFLATTGDSYRFSNGFEYSATNPETPSLLTVNLPVGVQMGQQPGKISVQDSGHGIIKQRDTDPFINFDNFNGLRVKPNQTLSLIGGGIDLVGGNLIASEGTIQLGSIAQGRVNLNIAQQSPWLLDYQEAEKYQDINLSQKALVDVSGVNTGFIQIHGANITLKDGSVISNNNFQTSNSQGEIIVKAEDNLVVTGVDENSLTRSAIAANALGSQQGAAINVNSKKLLVTDGGFIGAVSYNSGRGGDVSIKVDDSLVINGFAIANSIFPSTILTVNFASGDAGNLTFDTKSMEILAGGTINSTVLGTGQGGDILVNAAESITSDTPVA